MAIFDSRQLKQESDESLDKFYRKLKEKAFVCEFHDEDNEIKTQIIQKTSDPRLRRKAVREQLEMTTMLTYGKSLVKSDLSASKLEEARNSLKRESTNHLEFNSQNNLQRRNNQNKHRPTRHGTRHQHSNVKSQQTPI